MGEVEGAHERNTIRSRHLNPDMFFFGPWLGLITLMHALEYELVGGCVACYVHFRNRNRKAAMIILLTCSFVLAKPDHFSATVSLADLLCIWRTPLLDNSPIVLYVQL